MADKKVTELNLHLPLELSDVIPVVNSNETKKTSLGSINSFVRNQDTPLTASGITVSDNIVPTTPVGATLGTVDKPFSEIFVQSGSISIKSDTPGDPSAIISNKEGNLEISVGGMKLVQPGNSFFAETGSFSYLSGSLNYIGEMTVDGNINFNGQYSILSASITDTTLTFTKTDSSTFDVELSGSIPPGLGQSGLGWARYDDGVYTTGSSYTLTVADGEQTLPNSGSVVINDHMHSTVEFYDTGSQTIQVENENDVYVQTVVLKAKTSNVNGTYFRIQLDSLGPTPYERVGKDLFFPKGNGIWHEFHEVFQYYGDADFKSNGNRWKIQAFNHTVEIADIIYFIQRTQNHGGE